MAEDSETPAPDLPIPLVLIGASAGGLDPLEAFFEAVPEDAGWSFIVIQHLSPDYKSMMRELLGRRSPLSIQHIDDGTVLQPNTIYLNRPSTFATLEDEVFHTRSFEHLVGLPNQPIDAMLASVAGRVPERTAAVVLSGSGTDGTRGAESLHAAAGLVLVQSLSEAAFASMPRSVLVNEVADQVLPAKDMPAALQAYFVSGARKGRTDTIRAASGSRNILKLLEDAHGIDFSDYKPHNVQRRIERRQHLQGYPSLEAYRDALEAQPALLEELYHDLLIGVTEFYRDAEAMTALRKNVLDRLAAEQDEAAPLRIWVPACSSGEEAYTIAIELSEALAAAGSKRSFRIIATDVHRRSVDFASAGCYQPEALGNVPQALRERYFSLVRGQYIVNPALRQKIIFSVHDVLSNPPFMKLDLISCRNLLIYLTDAAQARLLSMFLFGLNADGCLLLGSSESLGRYADQFQVLDQRARLFRKASTLRMVDRSVLSARMGTVVPAPGGLSPQPRQLAVERPNRLAENRTREALVRSYDALLKRYAPSSILVTENGAVIAWFGAASAFIDTVNNLVDRTVEDIVHPDLHFPINVALEKLRKEQLEPYSRRVDVTLESGHRISCTLYMEPLQEVHDLRLMLVTMTIEEPREAQPRSEAVVEAAPDPQKTSEDARLLGRRINELERDLRLTEETLQHVTERLEASGEELQASNEELQASNEELQASNEELQSSNEELHAVNEELVSVSAEHERQIQNLSELNTNIELVLEALDVGVIFVDRRSRVRRFSEIIARRFALEPHDILRSLSVIGPRLSFVDLPAEVEAAMESGTTAYFTGRHGAEQLSVQIRPATDVTEATPPDANGAALIFTWRAPEIG